MAKRDPASKVDSSRGSEALPGPGLWSRLVSAIERTNPSPRLVATLVLLWIAAALVTLYFHDPAAAAGFFPPCPFHYLTGLHCPGCGTLRATHQLLHGHPLAALDLNPLMVLSLPFIAYALVSYIGKTFANRPLPRVFWPPWAIWTLLGLIVAYWVLRNIPVYPLSLLAP